MFGIQGRLTRAFGLSLALLASACATIRSEDCSQETLPGRWKAVWTAEYWTFEPDGRLLCEGNCYYGAGVGKPKAWGYEPEASLWSQPIDHIKLVFTKKSFEGTLGAYRCTLDRTGQRLVLRPFSAEELVFERAGVD